MSANPIQNVLQLTDEVPPLLFFFFFKQLSVGSSHAIVRADPIFLFVAMVINAKICYLNTPTGEGGRATYSTVQHKAVNIALYSMFA